MSRKLPEELAPVLARLDRAWPLADEDGLRQAAAKWREFGAESERLGGLGGASAGRVAGENSGRAVEAFADHWRTFSGSGRGYLDDARQAADLMAKAFDKAAQATDTCKAELVSTLTALADELEKAQQHAAAVKDAAAEVSAAAESRPAQGGVFGAVAQGVGVAAAGVRAAAADTVARAAQAVAVEAAKLKVAGLLEELGRAMKAAMGTALREPALTAMGRLAVAPGGPGSPSAGGAVQTLAEVVNGGGGPDGAGGLPAVLAGAGVGADGSGLKVVVGADGKPVIGPDGKPVVGVEGLTVELGADGRPELGPDGKPVLNGPDGEPLTPADLVGRGGPGGKHPVGTVLDGLPAPVDGVRGPLTGTGVGTDGTGIGVTAGRGPGAGPEAQIQVGPIAAAAGVGVGAPGERSDAPPARPAPAGPARSGGYGPVSIPGGGGYASAGPAPSTVSAGGGGGGGGGGPASLRTDSVLSPPSADPAPVYGSNGGAGGGGYAASSAPGSGGGGHSSGGGQGGSGGGFTGGATVPVSGGGTFGAGGGVSGGTTYSGGGTFSGGGTGAPAGGQVFGGAPGAPGAGGAAAGVVGVPAAGAPAAGTPVGGTGQAGGPGASAGSQPGQDGRPGAGLRPGAGAAQAGPVGVAPVLTPGPGRSGAEGGGYATGRRFAEHPVGEGTASWATPVATGQVMALHIALADRRGPGGEEPDAPARPRGVAGSRPYGLPGGLGPVDPQHQAELERRVPRGTGGLPAVHPDPAAGGWVEVLNDGGYREPGRANNSLEIALSSVDTYSGRPSCAAPRIPTEGDAGERGGRDRAERELGAPFRDLGDGAEAHERLASDLLRAGHGAQAVLLTLDAFGRSHAWNAVNHQGVVGYLDHQACRQGPAPLHSADHGLWAIALDPDGGPLDLSARRPRPAARPSAAPEPGTDAAPAPAPAAAPDPASAPAVAPAAGPDPTAKPRPAVPAATDTPSTRSADS